MIAPRRIARDQFDVLRITPAFTDRFFHTADHGVGFHMEQVFHLNGTHGRRNLQPRKSCCFQRIPYALRREPDIYEQSFPVYLKI